jgi:FSR family fosmidomycin resistance protein-like MFS transporter
MTADTSPPAPPVEATVMPVILAVALGHLLNDLMQSLIPAVYPLLRDNLALSFTQVGLVTLVFQGTASVLQPLVGLYTDRRPLPWALAAGMASTGAGLILLAHAGDYAAVLVAVALVGLGSSIFHPESSRIARLAAGMRPGLAQAVFQVGGNAGAALGPLAAAWLVLRHGQTAIEWFAAAALGGMALLALVGRWFVRVGAGRMRAARARRATARPLPAPVVRRAVAVLVVLTFSKFVYTASFSSYFTFYLIDRFGTSVQGAQIGLFVFLAAVAVGTVVGGPIGDRIGRRRVIWLSILGVLPLSLAVPVLPLVPCVAVAAAAGFVLASAFPAIVVYAQDLMPARTGMIAGLFFGLAFGMGAIGAAGIGILADAWGIEAVYRLCALLPALGLLAALLPDVRTR